MVASQDPAISLYEGGIAGSIDYWLQLFGKCVIWYNWDMKFGNRDIFGPVENIFIEQQKLRSLTLQKERSNGDLQKSTLLNEGQSSVFLSPFDFAYFFSLYEITGRYIEQLSKNKNNFRVLEIGCGNGWGGYFLANKFLKVKFMCTNHDQKSIEYAKRIYGSENLKFSVLDGLDQRKLQGQFDLVLFVEVFEHFSQKDEAFFLNESLNSLKENGVIIFSTPSREFTYSLPTLGWISHKIEYKSVDQLGVFLNSQGLTNFEINKLVGKNYTKRKRIIALLLLPFVIILHLLSGFGWRFRLFDRFFINRKMLSDIDCELLDLNYIKGTGEINRNTLGYIVILGSQGQALRG